MKVLSVELSIELTMELIADCFPKSLNRMTRKQCRNLEYNSRLLYDFFDGQNIIAIIEVNEFGYSFSIYDYKSDAGQMGFDLNPSVEKGRHGAQLCYFDTRAEAEEYMFQKCFVILESRLNEST